MKICLWFLLALQVAVVGERRTFLEDGQYGLKYFPDGPVSVLATNPQYRVIFPATVSSYLLEGPDMASLHLVKKVLAPGEKGSFDNGYAGIYGVYCGGAKNRVLAIYHAEDHEGMKRFENGVPGFFASIALATSTDGGATFTKGGQIITGSLPKGANDRLDQGCGEPSLVADKSGRYLYCFYTDHSRVDKRGVQICLARSPLSGNGKPGTWKKYFDGGFTEPGLGGKDTPVLSAAQESADAVFPNVTYSKESGRYVMVLNLVYFRETIADKSGIYISYSEDGLRWSKPGQLVRGFSIAKLDREVLWHPTLIGDWLFYSYSPRWGHNQGRKAHYLVGQPVKWASGPAQ
jgi:hypothetical protein